jgi:glycosyltransferase involved in cell wall biosynthesis
MMKRHRLCFVGPMVGRNAGYLTTQGEVLADCFAAAGYPTISVSASPNRYARLVEIVTTILRKRGEVDVQCLQVFGGPSFFVEDLASWLGQKFGQSLVMVLRGGAMPDFVARYPAWSRRVLDRAHALVAPSPFLAQALSRYGFDVTVIPNVLDISAYPYRHRRVLAPRFFWMRAFHPIYNPQMAIRVLARVKKVFPNASLVIAGQDKGTLHDVQEMVRKLGLDDAVRFPGYLDMAAKAREGNAADIFLNTNRIDNMPVSVVEACAMGLPVVATNVGGIPQLLTDGETALLVPDDDDEAMAAASLRLLHDAALASQLSQNGRKLASLSSWEQVRPQWERLFASVLAQSSRNGECAG